MAEPVAPDERGSSRAGGAPSDGDETGAEELLTRVPLFEGLGRVELARLAAQLDLVEVDDGRVVVRQGEPGDTLYVVAGGSFGVFAASSGEESEVRLATLSAGDVFGEMALFTEVTLMMSHRVPDFAAGLALVAAWLLLGVATPAEALSGFASKEWLFVVSIYGLAAATASSGVLFRVGLLLARRLPAGLLAQSATLLLTGLALTPLVPSSTGRAALTSPLALAVAEALRLPERGRASALLGLGAWVGAGPLMFMFLNGSGTCLLAWGLLPEASRLHFTIPYWRFLRLVKQP